MSLAPFGTAHDALEDEQNTAVSRKPTRPQDEIVTDERGKRRFHGAFTGGFSAGYWNTVGSKEGWAPQTFKSTRNERSDAQQQSATDYMDEEDRGEFGFAARKIRARDDFVDHGNEAKAMPTETLAWERTGPTPSSAALPAELSGLADQLATAIRPINDSVGVRILKAMGWRPGKGIGPRLKRRALEKQKSLDARAQGRRTRWDEEAVREVEERLPEMEFSPDDIPTVVLRANTGTHGVGYRPLEHSNVLSEEFTRRVDALRTRQKSKGIRGQAFGVGAFEDEDDDVYTSDNLAAYDYELGGDTSVREVKRYESLFVPGRTTERPIFHTAPHPPPRFDAHHKLEAITLRDVPPLMHASITALTPLQKALFLGDRSGSVMELLSDADRKKLALLTQKADKKPAERAKEEAKPVVVAEPFEEEPMKVSAGDARSLNLSL